jgi:hypothetical protein
LARHQRIVQPRKVGGAVHANFHRRNCEPDQRP